MQTDTSLEPPMEELQRLWRRWAREEALEAKAEARRA
eukprot:CAMPEP_0172685290 /NCGR_PEP_ID=MMETSP1074-20121228/20139_1 /TAXON_ID=2916 /ORGANISM="Ceratium fusus, Strain PA161109" /LENGTH=36 /DNA_ID= /DNA_START= /DNA_END= /DNA_ORIENTATION=